MFKKYITYIIASFVSLIPLIGLFQSNLPLTHDGQDHVARIANFYQNLSDGNLVPRWAGNLNWGYGHPILMFLYPLPSYSASLFHLLGFSFVDSVKIVFGLSFVLSGMTMYLWLKSYLGEAAAFIGSSLYMFAPYRFVDLYVRGALGEHVAFIFPPLILYFILRSYKKYSSWNILGGSLSFAGLLLSHNAISLMFIPLIFLYMLYLYCQSSSKRHFMISCLCLTILGFSISAFFWIPAFFEGKYTLRDIVTKGSYRFNFIDFNNFLYSEWNYGGSGKFTVQVGILHWFFVILSLPLIFILFKKRNKLWIFSLVLLFVFLSVLFLMTTYSQYIWEKFTILQKFQFPWRFLSIIVFVASVSGALFVSFFTGKKQLIMVAVLLAVLLLLNKDYWKPVGYIYKPESFYMNIYDGTTDTGESAPIWSVRFMEKRPKSHLEVIDGKAEVKELKRASTLHTYNVIIFQTTRFRENTLYFPGWGVYIDGKPVNIEFQDQANRGLMTFFVTPGKHFLEVKFQETKLRLIANMISGLSLVFIFIYAILKKFLCKHSQ